MSSGTLKTLQKTFQTHVFKKTLPKEEIFPAERLSAYTDGYRFRLIDSLTETYSTLSHALGWDTFYPLAQAYVEAHFSQSPNINHYGEEFPIFIRSQPISSEKPCLPDLLTLEWFISQSFHAFHTPLHPDKINSLKSDQWEDASLVFQSSLYVLSSVWPIHDLWSKIRNHEHDFAWPTIPSSAPSSNIVIHRVKDDVYTEEVRKEEMDLLVSLKSGLTLGKSLENVPDACDFQFVQECFQRWFSLGWIADIR